jgi:hypothetical protein
LKVYPSVLCSKIWYIFSTAPNGQLMWLCFYLMEIRTWLNWSSISHRY